MSLLTDESGRPSAIATIAKDIFALKQAEAEIRQAVQRRDHFLAMLSHELRNPLGAVLNATYVLDRQQPQPATVSQPLSVIQRQSQQMARLLDDLLDVSRVTQGKIDIQREIFDIRSAVDLAVEAVRPQIEARGQELHVDVQEGPLYVNGDPARLQQVQVNLLTNAVKYTPSGGRIELSTWRENGQIAIRVSDSGQGIPANMLGSIFDMFVQNGGTIDGSDEGMGVGLTLARQLIEMHGGTITAHSAGLGEGSEFVVQLPCSDEPDAKPAKVSEGPSQVVGGRVLVIEDNADSREMLKSLLELDGYQVQVAEDGRKGLEALKQSVFDVALVDIGLPGIDGYQVARSARASQKANATRLVALTGYGRSVDRKAVREAGFDDHLIKPLKPEELTQLMRKPR
jgi:two-component system CheB/CheR fusion protein